MNVLYCKQVLQSVLVVQSEGAAWANMLTVCLSVCLSLTVSAGELSQQRLADRVLDYNSTLTCPGSSNRMQTSISFQCGQTMVREESRNRRACIVRAQGTTR